MNRSVYNIAAAFRRLSPVDLGEYDVIKGKGMTFRVKCYDANHAGRLCLMEMSGFLGLMKMETAVFSPTIFDILNTCKPCDRTEKMKKNAEFTEGLLQNGGPAVNQFKKMIGEEKTEEFLRKYMFCCEE